MTDKYFKKPQKNNQRHGGTAAPPRSKIMHWKIIIRLINAYKRLNQFDDLEVVRFENSILKTTICISLSLRNISSSN